jgi:hypothetical protein
MRRILLVSLVLILYISTLLNPAASVSALSSTVVINEIQTGGLNELLIEDGKLEFIELYNNSSEPIDISGWRLQYFASTKEDVLNPSSLPTRELILLDGLLAGEGHALFSYEDYIINADDYFGQGSTSTSGLLAKSGGHIRLLNSSGAVVDVVGWGTAKSPETKAVPEIKPGFSAERILAYDTDSNFTDFAILELPTPSGGSITEIVPVPETEVTVPVCEGLIISELMPNPDGNDTGNEFIELYNPTDNTIYLDDCLLKTSGSSVQYIFPVGSSIQAGQYIAFYDKTTGLSLPNAAGGEVILRGSNSDYVIQYPSNIGANHSWGLFEGTWNDSSRPTPNTANIMPTETLGISDDGQTLEPCPVGKYRNPETNRCKNLQLSTAVLASCAVGQVRNPETNRCRSIATLAASLIPCRADQERNPETNRCRNIASSVQSSCQEGYERNPETNRCRKIPAKLAASPSVGELSGKSQDNPNIFFLTIMSTIVLGYGVYEYRRDISNYLAKIKSHKLAKQTLK